ncbi:MAG: hypothetical protein JWM68_2502 [Verrucomicrobiales bacterium]|nr:hypothetical protein [Verrucomicrobiales bacterium]
MKDDIDDELHFHMEMRTAENVASGMSPDQAAREARKRFGNFQSVREECRDTRGASFGETIIQDVRFGARMLRKKPGFTAIAILTLTLGIGANTAIFSFINAILLRSLPYDEPDRIVQIWERDMRGTSINTSPRNFVDFRTEARSFQGLAVYRPVFWVFPGIQEPERVQGLRASPALFSVLRANPILGRIPTAEEDALDHDTVMVLSHRLWQRHFGGRTNIIGSTLTLEGSTTFTVIGVMPPGFNFPNPQTEFWMPTAFRSRHLKDSARAVRGHEMIGRLATGVPIEQARAEMDSIVQRIVKQFPNTDQIAGAKVIPLHEEITGNFQPTLLILFGAVGLVLLIACANVANLLLVRSVTRQKEMAIRSALGASRIRIIRQLLAESVLLSLAGGIAGVLLAFWLTHLLVTLAPSNVPRLAEIRVDRVALVFTFAVSLLTGIFSGLFPAIHASKVDLLGTLNDGGKGSSGGLRSQRARSILVIAQIAVALVLLVGAGLLVKSLVRLQSVDLGFDPKGLYFADVDTKCDFPVQLKQRIEALSGDYSAGLVILPPCPARKFFSSISFAVERPPVPGDSLYAMRNDVSTSYFKTMGIPLLKGRIFTEEDPQREMVINDTLARRYFPNEDPIGKRIVFEGGTISNLCTIVGIVRSVRQTSPAKPAAPEFFRRIGCPLSMTLVVRSHSDLKTVSTAIRREARLVDSTLAVGEIKSAEMNLARTLAEQKFRMTLLSGLALTALLLAAIGIYGILAYAVTQRTHEIGIRMALGAPRSNVLWLVFRQGMKLAIIGVGLGVIAALGLSRFMTSFLFEVTPTDPLTFFGIALLLFTIASIACWLPARRATKVDPMVALRCE